MTRIATEWNLKLDCSVNKLRSANYRCYISQVFAEHWYCTRWILGLAQTVAIRLLTYECRISFFVFFISTVVTVQFFTCGRNVGKMPKNSIKWCNDLVTRLGNFENDLSDWIPSPRSKVICCLNHWDVIFPITIFDHCYFLNFLLHSGQRVYCKRGMWGNIHARVSLPIFILRKKRL